MAGATAQMVRPGQAISKATSMWNPVFSSDQRTVQESATFVKKLLFVGISSVTYLRTLFPERAYGDADLDGLNLKLLLEDSTCQSAKALVTWIQACGEAIDKQYLRQLTMAIYENASTPDVVLETYTYKFKYTKQGEAEMEMETSSSLGKSERKFDVRKPTQKLLRTVLVLTQSLQPLPKKVYLGIRLGYYDEVTPSDFEPKGFKTSPFCNFQFEDDSINLDLGEVSTLFHSVKVRVRIEKRCFDGDEKEAAKTGQQETEESDMVLDDKGSIIRRYAYAPCSQGTGTTQEDHEQYSQQSVERTSFGGTIALNKSQEISSQINVTDSVPCVTPPEIPHSLTSFAGSSQQVVPELTGLTSDIQLSTYTNVQTPLKNRNCHTPVSASSVRSVYVTSPSVPDPGEPVRCACGVNLDDGLMILCEGCSNWQHAVCFSIFDESEAPSRHICELCCYTLSLPCTDKNLPEETDVRNICLYRRILFFLRDFNSNITISVISQRLGVDVSEGRKILMKLRSDKIIQKRNAKGDKKFNKENLALAFLHTFKRPVSECLTRTASAKSQILEKDVSPKGSVQHLGSNDTTPDLPILLRSLVDGVSTTKMKKVVHSDESPDVPVGTQFVDCHTDAEQLKGKSNEDFFTQSEALATVATDVGDHLWTQDMLQETMNGEEESCGKTSYVDQKVTGVMGEKRLLLSRKAKRHHKCISSEVR